MSAALLDIEALLADTWGKFPLRVFPDTILVPPSQMRLLARVVGWTIGRHQRRGSMRARKRVLRNGRFK